MKIAIVSLLSILCASGGEITLASLTLGNQQYEQATVSKIDEIFAKITHASGIKRVPMVDLPSEIQSAIGYDPEKDKEAQSKKQSAAKTAAERAELLSSSFIARAKVQTVLPDGLIVTNMVHYLDPKKISQESLFIQIPTIGKGYISDGFYQFRVSPVGTYEYTTVTGTSRTIRKVTLIEDVTAKKNTSRKSPK